MLLWRISVSCLVCLTYMEATFVSEKTGVDINNIGAFRLAAFVIFLIGIVSASLSSSEE